LINISATIEGKTNLHKSQKPATTGWIYQQLLFAVGYAYQISIYMSFHHALCDGKGIKPFIEILT